MQEKDQSIAITENICALVRDEAEETGWSPVVNGRQINPRNNDNWFNPRATKVTRFLWGNNVI